MGLPVRRCALAGDGAFPDPSWNLPKGLVADWPAPRLSSTTLRLRLALDGDRSSEWHPGLPNPNQLPGTVRTLDNVDGATELRCDRLPVDQRSGRENDAHCAMGVISRSGWVSSRSRPITTRRDPSLVATATRLTNPCARSATTAAATPIARTSASLGVAAAGT